MIDTKELRRLAQAATPGPWKILPVGDGRQKFAVADRKSLSILTVTDEGEATFGTVYDDADAKFIAAANPATVNDLLDRLEAAESDAAHQKALADSALRVAEGWEEKCNSLRADKATLQQMTYSLKDRLEAAEKERDAAELMSLALQAKVAEMERQEPVGEIVAFGESLHEVSWNRGKLPPLGAKLYTLPGAKGEEK